MIRLLCQQAVIPLYSMPLIMNIHDGVIYSMAIFCNFNIIIINYKLYKLELLLNFRVNVL